MMNFKTAVRFLSIFSISYLLLLWPPLRFDRGAEKYFRALGNQVYNRLGTGEVIFLQEEQRPDHDTKLYLSSQSLRQHNNDYKGAIYPIKLRRIGFISTAFLMALFLATPLPWKRKTIALALGFLLMSVFVIVKLRIIILHHYTISNWVGLYQETSQIRRIEFWNEIFARSNTNSYYFAVLVWLGLSFGRTEWQKLTGTFTALSSSEIFKRKQQHGTANHRPAKTHAHPKHRKT